MSLLVWLPLDGNLNNQGLLNIVGTNYNSTVSMNGKIGSCYSFNGTDTRIEYPHNKSVWNNKEITIAFWYKYAEGRTSNTLVDIAADLTAGYTYSSSGLVFSYWRAWSNNGTRTGDSGSTSHYYDATKWHHIAIVYDHNINKIYVDGILSDTFDRSSKYTTNFVPLLGSSYNKITLAKSAGSSPYASGFLNDVRIYDNVLSDAEIHELAQGLILHYKMNQLPDNITNAYNMSSWNTSANTGGFSIWGPSGHSGTSGKTTDRNYIYDPRRTYAYYISEDAGTGKYNIFYQSPAFDGGYRSLSAIIKEENGLPINDTWCKPGWNANVIGTGHAEAGKWTRITDLGNGFYLCQCDGLYQDGSNDLVDILVSPGYKIYISEIWLENNKQVASNILFPRNKVIDSSGYNNHGLVIGNLNLNKETKRYDFSTSYTASDLASNETDIAYIQTPLDISGAQQMTITWWAKPSSGYGSSTNHAAFCTSSNINRPTDYNTTAFHHRDAGFDIYTSDGIAKRLTFNQYTANEWHHYAVKFDGNTAYAYKDGVQTATVEVGTNKMLSAFSDLYIGYSQAGGAKRKTVGLYSDFRIYCTALSVDDIKALYNIGVSIDNKQNLHTYEIREQDNSVIQLLKTGVFLEDELIESDSTQLKSNKIVETNEIIEI